MSKSVVIFIAALLFPFAVHATDVASGKFSFDLKGEWHVTKDEKSGAITAVQQNKEKPRAFILSVHKLASTKQTIDALLYLRNYLNHLSNKNHALVKEADFTQYKTRGGAPFDYIAYTDKARKGFFIGAILGSNAGVVLVTYEGRGSYKNGTAELKSILDHMRTL